MHTSVTCSDGQNLNNLSTLIASETLKLCMAGFQYMLMYGYFSFPINLNIPRNVLTLSGAVLRMSTKVCSALMLVHHVICAMQAVGCHVHARFMSWL